MSQVHSIHKVKVTDRKGQKFMERYFRAKKDFRQNVPKLELISLCLLRTILKILAKCDENRSNRIRVTVTFFQTNSDEKYRDEKKLTL